MRGGNPLKSGFQTQAECTITQGKLLSFPLFRPIKVWKTSRGQQSACGGRRAEGTSLDLGTVVCEPCLGDVAQLGEHLLCTQGVTGSSPVISTSTLSTE